MQVQAALGSDIALVFDECTPFHADRDYTARSTERTHRWLDRCLEWHEREGPPRQAVFGIVQGGVHEDLRRESAEAVSAAGVDGLAIGGTLGRDKEEMHEVLAMTAPLLPVEAPKHLLGIGEVDDLLGGIALGLDVFDCAVPTRLARHGVALAPDPENRFRLDLRKGALGGQPRTARRRLPLPGLPPPRPRLRQLPVASRGADRGPPARHSTTSPTCTSSPPTPAPRSKRAASSSTAKPSSPVPPPGTRRPPKWPGRGVGHPSAEPPRCCEGEGHSTPPRTAPIRCSF